MINESNLEFHVELDDERKSASISIRREDQVLISNKFSTEDLKKLVDVFGNIRSQMLAQVGNDLPLPANINYINPRWYVLPSDDHNYVVLGLRDPRFDWLTVGFSKPEVINIIKYMRNVAQRNAELKPHSDTATVINAGPVVLSSEGLGFYFIGDKDKKIDLNLFAQLEIDSDRAVAIVAAAILEKRLEQLLRSRMSKGDSGPASQMFRPSGPLGPFSNKIDLAWMMGLISDRAKSDLLNIKNIRNEFAHQLQIDSFGVQSINDRCRNFDLVDIHFGPAEDAPNFFNMSHDEIAAYGSESSKRANPYFAMPEYQTLCSSPRFRYIMTAQILNYKIGKAVNHPELITPVI